jgi:hypothetical protein
MKAKSKFGKYDKFLKMLGPILVNYGKLFIICVGKEYQKNAKSAHSFCGMQHLPYLRVTFIIKNLLYSFHVDLLLKRLTEALKAQKASIKFLNTQMSVLLAPSIFCLPQQRTCICV